MDLGALESFVLFAELGSFSKVAEERCRTNAAISAQMKKLEEQYDARLFVKVGRNIELTSSGTELLYFARYILQLNKEAKKRLCNREETIELIIGSPSDYVNGYLLSLIDHLSTTLPRIHTKLVIAPSSQLCEMWRKNEIDIALFSSTTANGEGFLVGPVKGVWVASQSFEPVEHPRLSIILYDESCIFHQQALTGLREKGTNFNLQSTTSDSHTMCHLVEHRGVIAAMAKVSMRPTMKVIDDPRLPELPVVYLKLLVSEKFEGIDSENLVRVMRMLTLSTPDYSGVESETLQE